MDSGPGNHSSRPSMAAPNKQAAKGPKELQLWQYFLVQLYFEPLHQVRPHIVEVMLDVACRAMLIECFLVFPFLNEGNPTVVVRTLVQFVTDAPRFGMRRLHQHMKCFYQFLSLSF